MNELETRPLTSSARWRLRQIALGNCIVCGKVKASPHLRCRGCLDRANAIKRAKNAARIAERVANGEPVHGRRGWAGFQSHPENILRTHTPEHYVEAGRKGGQKAGQRKTREATALAMQRFRRLLLHTRVDLTPAEIVQLEPVIGVVYREGITRGYSCGFEAGRRQRKTQAARQETAA